MRFSVIACSLLTDDVPDILVGMAGNDSPVSTPDDSINHPLEDARLYPRRQWSLPAGSPGWLQELDLPLFFGWEAPRDGTGPLPRSEPCLSPAVGLQRPFAGENWQGPHHRP